MRRIYLDWNATAPVRPEARQAAITALDKFGNPSSIHEEGRLARRIREQAREQIADWLKVSPEAVTFTSGGTESNAMAIHGLSRLDPSGIAAASSIEHPSVMESVKAVAKMAGTSPLMLPVHPTGTVDPDVSRQLMTGHHPGFLSIQVANNETGVIQPVREIISLAAGLGFRTHVDAVQTPGRIPVPDDLWGADLITLSGHKFGALKGCGLLINPRRIPLVPLLPGGLQERGRRAGTENLPAIASLGAAVEAFRRTEKAEQKLLSDLDILFTGLLARTPYVLNSGEASRLPNTWNIHIGKEAEPVIQALDLEGIAVSSGSACSSGSIEPSPVLLAMGFPAGEAKKSLRISAGRLTTPEDIEQFFAVLAKILSRN